MGAAIAQDNLKGYEKKERGQRQDNLEHLVYQESGVEHQSLFTDYQKEQYSPHAAYEGVYTDYMQEGGTREKSKNEKDPDPDGELYTDHYFVGDQVKDKRRLAGYKNLRGKDAAHEEGEPTTEGTRESNEETEHNDLIVAYQFAEHRNEGKYETYLDQLDFNEDQEKGKKGEGKSYHDIYTDYADYPLYPIAEYQNEGSYVNYQDQFDADKDQGKREGKRHSDHYTTYADYLDEQGKKGSFGNHKYQAEADTYQTKGKTRKEASKDGEKAESDNQTEGKKQAEGEGKYHSDLYTDYHSAYQNEDQLDADEDQGKREGKHDNDQHTNHADYMDEHGKKGSFEDHKAEAGAYNTEGKTSKEAGKDGDQAESGNQTEGKEQAEREGKHHSDLYVDYHSAYQNEGKAGKEDKEEEEEEATLTQKPQAKEGGTAPEAQPPLRGTRLGLPAWVEQALTVGVPAATQQQPAQEEEQQPTHPTSEEGPQQQGLVGNPQPYQPPYQCQQPSQPQTQNTNRWNRQRMERADLTVVPGTNIQGVFGVRVNALPLRDYQYIIYLLYAARQSIEAQAQQQPTGQTTAADQGTGSWVAWEDTYRPTRQPHTPLPHPTSGNAYDRKGWPSHTYPPRDFRTSTP